MPSATTTTTSSFPSASTAPAPTPPAAPTDLRGETAAFLADLAAAESEILRIAPDITLEAAADRVRSGTFRLVVMGEVKRGKSSFINALVAHPGLVPVQSDVATSTVFKIRYGDIPRHIVRFQPDAPHASLEIPATELDAYGTENGNPQNAKKVECIEIEVPAPVLENGLVIVDTPGVGGFEARHREITYRHAPEADAVFFILETAGTPIGRDEISFLSRLRKITSNIIFIQTKTDDADSPDAIEQRRHNNLAILRDTAGFPPEIAQRYFCLSSRMKARADEAGRPDRLAASGFPALLAYFNEHLVRRLDINITYAAIARALPRLPVIDAEIESRRRIAEADSREKCDEIERELADAEAALKRWENEERPGLLSDFASGIGLLKNDIAARLAAAIKPGGEISAIARAELASCLSATAAYECFPRLAADCPAAAAQALLDASRTLNEEALALVAKLAARVGASANTKLATVAVDTSRVSSAKINTNAAGIFSAKAREDTLLDKAQGGLIGAGAAAAAAFAAGTILGSVVPVVGTVIGGQLGLAIAALAGGALTITREAEAGAAKASAEIMSEVEKFLETAATRANDELALATREIERATGDAVRALATETRVKLARRAREVAARRNQSAASLAAERTANEADAATAARLRAKGEALAAYLLNA
jgi:hypothetical protein